jgi:hypothetical protein
VLTSTARKQSSPARTGLSQLVRRHPLAAFLVLTYGLTWALWIPLDIFRDAVAGPYTSLALLIGSNLRWSGSDGAPLASSSGDS